MATKTYTNVEIITVANSEVRNAAFAKGINRDVNLANARKIATDIRIHGYREAELIQVIPGEKAIAKGDIQLVDINNNIITSENANHYFLVVDGQHRIFATSIYNSEKEVKPIQAPAVVVKLNDNETIAEYISAINVTKMEWKPLDYVRGAANVQQTPLLLRYMELIKCEDNSQGYPLSTINLIFFGSSKALSKGDFSLLCQGKTEKGIKTKKKIIEGENIERGNRYIDLCTRLGFSQKDIAKRFLIERFEKLRNSKGEDYAFKVFNSITQNDRQAMYNEKGSLCEINVLSQFEMITHRLDVA